MKKYLFIPLSLLGFFSLHAQTIKGTVQDENDAPIAGAIIRWQGVDGGVLSSSEGSFSIDKPASSSTLIIQNLSYRSDTVQIDSASTALSIVLQQDNVRLKEVEVLERAPGLINNRNSINLSQMISSAELCKAACCNLSESFLTNPSVDVAYSDAATGAKQIKLLGLAGTYVQMLSENVPSLRGISAPFGLGYTPGPWMESIQVSKGTSSVINGYESVTGQINVEYLKPSKADPLSVNAYTDNEGRLEANVMSAIPLTKKLSTSVLAHIEDERIEHDNNHDNFMDMPMMRQQNVMNKWQYLGKNYMFNLMLRALNENRMGGQLSNVPNPYKIEIDTRRYEFYAKNGFIFHDKRETSIGFIVSGSWHENNSMFGMKMYDGEQTNWHANLIYQTQFSKKHKLSAGGSWNYDRYNEALHLIPSAIPTPFASDESTPGIFAEYTFNNNDKFIALLGLRADNSSEYGSFVTPRVHVKYSPIKALSLRANAGKGYRSPKVLAENSFLLASSRSLLIATDLKQEEAWNYGATATWYIPIRKRDLTVQAEWFYTDFLQQAIANMDANPHEVSIANLNGTSYASSMQLELSYEPLRGLTLTAAHRISDTRATINGVLREKALVNRSKTVFTSSYQTKLKKWQFDLTTQINGGGRLPDPDPINPKWQKEFDAYTLLNAQVTKYFRTWSIYLGGENLTGFTQKNPIIDVVNPNSPDFDASMVWGPIQGAKIYAGFRWALSKK